MARRGVLGRIAGGLRTVFGKKSDTFENLSLLETYPYDYWTIENIDSFYKLTTKINSIPKSLSEISQAIISKEWKIQDKGSEKEVKKIPDLLKQLIEQPGPNYTFSEFITLINEDLHVGGNIFGYLTQKGKSVQLDRIDPRNVFRNNGEWWENDKRGVVRTLKPAYLIHVKFAPDPWAPLWGKGIIAQNITLFTQMMRMLEFRENFYKNGCFPKGVFSIENSDAAGGLAGETRLEAKIDDRHGGSKNAGKPLVLSGKVSYQQTQMDPTALKISEEMILLDKKVMAAFGLPRYLMELGLRESGQKFNNHALQQEHFVKSTIIPVARKLESLFTNLVKRFNENWEFKFDIHSEVYAEKDLLAMVDNGTITRAEMRELLAIPKGKNKNLETHLVSGMLKPLDDVVEGGSNMGAFNPSTLPGSGSNNPQLPPSNQPKPGEPSEPPEPAKPTSKKPPKSAKKIENGRKREHSWRDEHYLSEPEDDVWSVDELKKAVNRKRIRQDLINLNSRTRVKKTKEQAVKFKSCLMETYGSILANVAKNADAIEVLSKPKTKATSRDASEIIESIYEPGEDLVRMEKITLPLYQSVGEATYSNTANVLTISTPFNIADPGVADKVNLMRKTGPLVMQTTKGKLTKIIQSGIMDGKTHNEIAKDIWRRFVDENNNLTEEFSKIYREGVKPKDFDAVMTKGDKLFNRATIIARTEVARANRLFAAESMKESGVVKTITIINCEPDCPICAPHQNIELDFSQAADISNLHPNCSGAIVPGTISSD